MLNIRRYLSPEAKEIILNSLPFRILQRWQLRNPEIRISLELTTKCNANCFMCTRKDLVACGGLNVGEMDRKMIEKVLDDTKKLVSSGKRVVMVPMGLGEPLLYSDLIWFIKKVKKISKSIKFVLVTNGILLDRKWASNLVDAGVDEICLSLNTTNEKLYKTKMGVDRYKAVVENIKKLLEIRNKKKKKETAVIIQYLDYGGQAEKIKEKMSEWKSLMRYNDKCFVHQIVNQAGLYKGKSSKFGCKFPCTQPLWRIAIKINGDIYPCDPALYSGNRTIDSLKLGNVMDVDLSENINERSGKRYQIVEKMKRNNYKDINNCRVCTTRCLGGNCFFEFGGRWW